MLCPSPGGARPCAEFIPRWAGGWSLFPSSRLAGGIKGPAVALEAEKQDFLVVLLGDVGVIFIAAEVVLFWSTSSRRSVETDVFGQTRAIQEMSIENTFNVFSISILVDNNNPQLLTDMVNLWMMCE